MLPGHLFACLPQQVSDAGFYHPTPALPHYLPDYR
jgi:hypothetical protein